MTIQSQSGVAALREAVIRKVEQNWPDEFWMHGSYSPGLTNLPSRNAFLEDLVANIEQALAQHAGVSHTTLQPPSKDSLRRLIYEYCPATDIRLQERTRTALCQYVGYTDWDSFLQRPIPSRLPQPLPAMPEPGMAATEIVTPDVETATRRGFRLNHGYWLTIPACILMLLTGRWITHRQAAVMENTASAPSYVADSVVVLNTVREAIRAEMQAYRRLPAVDSILVDTYFTPSGSARQRIIHLLLRHQKKQWSLTDTRNPSTAELLSAKLLTISDTIATVETSEYWYLRWFDNRNQKQGYIYSEKNSQYYQLIKGKTGWRVALNYYPRHHNNP